ncbi:MAG: alpha/beta hydrolase [Chryseolinea sp.]
MKLIFLMILLGLNTVSNAINPSRVYERTPDMYGLKYSQYQTMTTDNYSINVWEYAVSDSIEIDKTIIFVGTDAGNMSHLIARAIFFLGKGVRVISFDYRGFGKSADFEINKNFLFYPDFALDLDSVIKTTRKKYPSDKIGLYALSMGTYISLIRKEKIEFLIAEGFYNNPQEVVNRIKINKGIIVLLPDQTRTIQKLEPSSPLIIFCASNDKTTMTDDARTFSKNNNAKIVEFNGEHLTGFQVLTKVDPGDEYLEMVMDFIKLNKL